MGSVLALNRELHRITIISVHLDVGIESFLKRDRSLSPINTNTE